MTHARPSRRGSRPAVAASSARTTDDARYAVRLPDGLVHAAVHSSTYPFPACFGNLYVSETHRLVPDWERHMDPVDELVTCAWCLAGRSR